MKKEFLIRLINYEDEKMIKAFFSNNITELLKLYLFAKEEEVYIDIPIEDNGRSKYDGHEAYIKDVRISFGGKEALTCLNVYVEVV